MLTGPKKLWKTLKKTRAQQWNSEVHRLPKCYHSACDLSFLCNVFPTLRKPGRLTSGKLASHLRELVRKSDGVSNAPFDDDIVARFPGRHPDLRETILQQQTQDQLRILAIRLLLAHAPGANLGRISDPQLKLQLGYESFEPACVPAGFHPNPHLLVRQAR
jgi:hypothetical protein